MTTVTINGEEVRPLAEVLAEHPGIKYDTAYARCRTRKIGFQVGRAWYIAPRDIPALLEAGHRGRPQPVAQPATVTVPVLNVNTGQVELHAISPKHAYAYRKGMSLRVTVGEFHVRMLFARENVHDASLEAAIEMCARLYSPEGWPEE